LEHSKTSESEVLVCSVFDMTAGEHGPLFFARSLPLMWRAVDQIMRQSTVSTTEFAVYVHGLFDIFDHKGAFHPYMEAVVYSLDHGVISLESVSLKIKEVNDGFSAR